MKSYKKYLSLLSFFGVGLFGAMVGTYIVSAHGGDSNKIHGCVASQGVVNGFLRIVGANESCATGETPLDWNIQGIPGPAGPTGVPGQDAPFACTHCMSRDILLRKDITTLQGANFDLANLSVSSFSSPDNLSNTSFVDAVLNEVQLINVNLSNAVFTRASLRSAEFNGGSNLTSAEFTEAYMQNASFGDVIVDTTDFSGAYLLGATFYQTTIEDSDFTNSNLNTGNFNSANVTNTNFTNANLTNIGTNDATFTGNTFTNANFTNAYLFGASFTGNTFSGATWSNTTCPDGTNSDNNGNTCEGHLNP